MFVIDKSKYICDNILYNYCRKEDLSFTYIFTTSAREIEMEVIYEKRLSIFLIFVLLFSLSSTTVASALPNKSELPGLYAAEDGDMFILQSEDRDATIITNDTHHSMTVSIKYSHNPDTVYQWYISDYPMPFEPSSSAFWTDIIAYAEDHISQAEEIIFVSNTPSEMHNSIQPFSSAGADIYPQLVKYVGTSPLKTS